MRRWMRYTGDLEIQGRKVEYFGPANWSRPGMLTFAETPSWKEKSHPESIVLDSRDEFYALFIEANNTGKFEYVTSEMRLPRGVTIGHPFKRMCGVPSPVAGSVYVHQSVDIGCHTVIDRGIYGEFTEIEEGTMIDNLVHVGHSAMIGKDVTIVAGTVVGGWTVIGDGAWIGMNVSLKDNIRIGDHALIGTGAVVLRSVPAYALVYGNPARQHGWVCSCRKPLEFGKGTLTACRCGIEYGLYGEEVVPC